MRRSTSKTVRGYEDGATVSPCTLSPALSHERIARTANTQSAMGRAQRSNGCRPCAGRSELALPLLPAGARHCTPILCVPDSHPSRCLSLPPDGLHGKGHVFPARKSYAPCGRTTSFNHQENNQ